MPSSENADEISADSIVRLRIDSGCTLTLELVALIEEMCDRVDAAPGVAIAVVGLGSGLQNGKRAQVGSVHTVSKWERALRRMERLAAPTIAVAGGDCSGQAVEVLLSCDYRVAAPDMRLSLPFAAGEPWPGMLVHRLANQLGVARARELVLFGAELSAERAVAIGLIDEIVEDVDEAVRTRIASFGSFVGSELAIRRRLLLDAVAVGFEDALGAHLAACDRALRRVADRGQVSTESDRVHNAAH